MTVKLECVLFSPSPHRIRVKLDYRSTLLEKWITACYTQYKNSVRQ